MTDSEEWIDPIFDAVFSDIQRSGYFDRVNDWEPKRAPGRGLTASVWVQSMQPIAGISGLNSTGCRVVFQLRAYKNIANQMKPGVPALGDSIDINMLKAMSNLSRRYHSDFDFGDGYPPGESPIRNVDLLGHWGIALTTTAGYLEQDKAWFRTMDMLIPCIVNDVWPQVSSP